MKLALALAVLGLSAAAAQAEPAATPPPAAAPTPAPAPGDVTSLPGVTVEPRQALPTAPCRETDRACYAVVANALKTRFPDVYWKLALKCMAEDMQDLQWHLNHSSDEGNFGGAQSAGERTFCAIAQADAKPPPAPAKR